MAQLVEFSRILIFKDTPEVRNVFGEPYPAPSIVSQIGPKFFGSSPSDNILTDPASQALLGRNLLHAMGVEETTNNYNLAPVSSGTAVIIDNKMYVGGNAQKAYTSITTGGTEVTVTGTGFTGIAVGSKIRLSSVTGITGLLTTTTYYAYAVDSTTLKLASSLAFAQNATAITSATGSFSGNATLTVANSGYTYTQFTNYVSPNPSLVVGDYIFWGDDPNNLKVGGKIKTVYSSGTEFSAGALYEFEQSTGLAFPQSSGEIVPQEIYYYRKSWNGKGISTDISNGFYVLIGVELDSSGKRSYFPWLDPNGPPSGASSEQRIIDVSTTQKYAYTDLIRVKRISKKYKSDLTGFVNEPGGVTEEIIPCTITRTNSFYWEAAVNQTQTGVTTTPGPPSFGVGTIITTPIFALTSFFTQPNAAQMPPWIAYYVNPYGDNSTKLDKNTTYVIEISERLPALYHTAVIKDTAFFNYANNGTI
jgi:hypothetical protein